MVQRSFYLVPGSFASRCRLFRGCPTDVGYNVETVHRIGCFLRAFLSPRTGDPVSEGRGTYSECLRKGQILCVILCNNFLFYDC